MFEKIFEEANKILDIDEDLELVEIIDSSVVGTPRKEGAFMFVDKNGDSIGTVGGGMVEYKAILDAKDFLLNKKDGEIKYELNQKAAKNIGMICGGDNLMKFTYLTNDEKSRKLLDELKDKNINKNVVFIFGGGHVSLELAKVVKYVGFEYVVWDDRSDFANKERFKEAKEVVCDQFSDILHKVNITEKDFVVIVTRGHACDYEIEKQVLKSKACYIGVIGSKNKNQVLYDKLIADGYTKEELARVCAPIGLSIAAETPEEIAISIVAELIMYRSMIEKRNKIFSDNKLVEIYKNKLRNLL